MKSLGDLGSELESLVNGIGGGRRGICKQSEGKNRIWKL